MGFFREQLVRALIWRFRRLPVPHSFQSVMTNQPQTIIITQSESPVIEALLRTHSRRIGIKRVERMVDSAASDSRVLRWGSMHRPGFIQLLGKCGEHQYFSTLTLFSLRGPVRSNPRYRMSLFDLLLAMVLSRSSALVCSTPFTLTEMERSGRRSPLRRIRLDFYRNLKLVRGIPLQTREEQARLIIESPEFTRELKIVAEKSRTSVAVMRRRAYREFYRIAANPLRPMYSVLAWIARFITRKLFSDVRIRGLETLIPAVRESTVVLVPMHRSHMDYIVLSSTLYYAHLNPPLVVAGMNLMFFPSGFLMRSVGAYFVRRDARQDRLHALLLKHYVSYLVKRGHMQEFFIEGGRSRSGKMLSPKLGILSVMVNTALRQKKSDLQFVPVSVTYENVVEDKVYADENTGRPKRRESFRELLRAGWIFNRSHGDVLIRFGEPISLAATHARHREIRGESDERSFVPNLATELVQRIRQQINPSLISLSYTALMLAPRYGLQYPDLVRTIKNLARLIEIARRVHPNIGEVTPSLDAFLHGRETIVRDLARGGVIESAACVGEEVFYIPGARRFTADFYRNASIHLFFEVSLFSLVHLRGRPINRDELAPYVEIFESDFLLPRTDEFFNGCDRLLAELERERIVERTPDGHRFACDDEGLFIPQLLIGQIQSFIYVIDQLRRHAAPATEGSGDAPRTGGGISYTELIKTLQSESRPARYVGMLTRTEAASKTALTTSCEILARLGIIRIRDDAGPNAGVELIAPNHPLIALLFESQDAVIRWMTLKTLATRRTET